MTGAANSTYTVDLQEVRKGQLSKQEIARLLFVRWLIQNGKLSG